MKKIYFISLIWLIVLSWCWKNITENTEVNQINNEPTETLIEENNNINISPKWVYFADTSYLDIKHYFLTDKEIIKDEDDYNFDNYITSKIYINETTFTWCEDKDYYDNRFNNYIDKKIKCREKDEAWYSITIPWWVYEAYLPTDQVITYCSTSNPIVCWGNDLTHEEVMSYYKDNWTCPPWFRFSKAWVSWPTDMCLRKHRWCHKKRCNEWEECWIKGRIDCARNSYWRDWYELWDPCEFFLWMWLVPGDWSCDHMLK